MTGNSETRGWVFYDADCSLCVRLAKRTQSPLNRRGFRLLPLQTPGAAERLGLAPAELLAQMHLLTTTGQRYGGADAVVEIARQFWWSRPLTSAANVPVVRRILRHLYALLAANRYCLGGTCSRPRRLGFTAWLPLLFLPVLVFALRSNLPGWGFMWLMAFALFAGCKWLTLRSAVAHGHRFGLQRALSYLFGWVGMEPEAFARSNLPVWPPAQLEWLSAFAKTLLGISLVWGGARAAMSISPLAAGWMGMVGLITLLHFGLFQLLALGWRNAGVPVKPLMDAPLAATSLGNLWGARWNTGFHVLAHKFVFRSLHQRIGGTLAVLAVFLVSGLIHELVITLPARGGYGLPTAYFLLQGLGLVLERSTPGRKLALANGVRGRVFALLVAAAPAFWLFPPVFVRNVILPMLHALGAT